MPLAQTHGVEMAPGISPWHLWGRCPIWFPVWFPIWFPCLWHVFPPLLLGSSAEASPSRRLKSWCPLLLMIYSQADPQALFSMRNCQTYFWSTAHFWMVTLLGGKWSNWEKLAASLWEVVPSCPGTALARAADSSPSASGWCSCLQGVHVLLAPALYNPRECFPPCSGSRLSLSLKI